MGWQASLGNRIRASAALAGALIAGPAWPEDGYGPKTILVSGEVIAVGVEDGTLLLDGERGLQFLVVHPDAVIRDSRTRAAFSLERIRPGDLVEYATEPTDEMRLVRRLVVTPERPWAEPEPVTALR